ncbi:hypothetical protein ABPG72_018570 [Tetrahymena utriculariae]
MKGHKQTKELLESFYKKNIHKGKTFIKNKFLAIGTSKRSLDRWLKLLSEGKSLTRKVGSGRPCRIATKQTIKKIKDNFNHRAGVSQRKYAKRIGCHFTYVGKILKNYTAIRCLKRMKNVKMTLAQMKLVKQKCQFLSKEYRNVDFILDDESYFTLTNSTLSGNDRFYSDDVEMTPDDTKYYYKSKYEQKVLMWIAISPRGVSKPFFLPSGYAVDQSIYKDKCLKPFLLPMIDKLYQDERYIFWPDLASAHYANSVQNFLKDKNIKYVQKDKNPANIPAARPIEDFWAYLKRLVYEGDWSAKTTDALQQRIKYCLSKIDINFVQDLAHDTHKRLRKFATGELPKLKK